MAIKYVCSIYRSFLMLFTRKGGLMPVYMLQDFELSCSGGVKAACRYFRSVPAFLCHTTLSGKWHAHSLARVTKKEVDWSVVG